jgi:DNA-3-methyladenine glycosylase
MSFSIRHYKKLTKRFYQSPVLLAAPQLLGKLLVKRENKSLFAGMITEVEAYDGAVDEAAHSFIGITKRNEVMFNEGGYLYVYFIYGMHYCCNVVVGPKNSGQAVLIRGVEPINEIDKMRKNRLIKDNMTNKAKLTNGPAKICQAFDITKVHNGTDLTKNHIFLCEYKNIPYSNIVKSERIGISKSKELKWRFYINNNTFV